LTPNKINNLASSYEDIRSHPKLHGIVLDNKVITKPHTGCAFEIYLIAFDICDYAQYRNKVQEAYSKSV